MAALDLSNPNDIPAPPPGGPGNPPPPATPPPPPQANPQPQVPPATQSTTISPPSGGGGGMMKKIIAIVVVLIVIGIGAFAAFTFLGGAGGEGENTENVELTWWGLWEDPSIVQPLIDEYQTANPNVKITFISEEKEEYRQRLQSALASNQGPDIFRVHNTWVPMFVNDLSVLPNDVMDVNTFRQTFYPVATSDLTTPKGIVGLPLEYDGLALYYNEDLLTTFAKTPPTTWPEFVETATLLTLTDDNDIITQAGAALGTTDNVDHWEDILSLVLIQNKADLENPIDTRTQGALQFYLNFREDGIWDSTQPPSTAAFINEKLAMYIAPSWRVFEIQDKNPSLNFKVVPIPQLPKDNPTDPDVTFATYWFEGVSEKSVHKAEAWKFLEFMSQKETLEKLFANASQTRSFGEPYPRAEMREQLVSHPFAGPFIQLAPSAKSWYLAGRTFDGETGINSALAAYFVDAMEARELERALPTLGEGVQQVLNQYGLQ